ncbi:MAG TPA: PIG-L family deacetylase [Candidatus Omnitrophota bacterium]|nr:PIG-L family deacetylase [Candidatus Omnitrophota bacterium]HRZ14487.1 PIG-L family deacetylase [Candidatus Omnitrophota bacterium]
MNILAIGAHPDDIEFGCGGALIKYVQAGHAVWLFILTDGSYGGKPEIRKREQEKAARFIGARRVFWGQYVDTELAEVGDRELIKKMDEVIHQVKPDMVFLNFPEDVHQDHRAAAQAGVSATRYIKEVLFYEVPTTQHFEPDVFVDIKTVLKKKQQLLQLHTSQVDKTRVQNLTILESVQSCANFRGFQGRVKYAEGFKALRLLREIA